MIRKAYMILSVAVILVFGQGVAGGVLFAGETDWKAILYLQSENTDGVSEQEAVFGVGETAETLPAPPPPPSFSAKMTLSGAGGNEVLRDIRKNGLSSYQWGVQITPKGNAIPVNKPGKCVLSWMPFQFGRGTFQLYKKVNGQNQILIPDMKKDRYVNVSNMGGVEYYTIVYKPFNKKTD